MSWPRQMIVGVTASFAIGVGVGLATFYFLGIPYLSRFWSYSAYQRAAYDGQIAVALLRQLRKGEAEHAISILEATLDTDIRTLAYYRESGDSVPVDVRFPGPVSALREYRREYPSSQTDRDDLAVLNRALIHEPRKE